jgi:hypothetical protein
MTETSRSTQEILRDSEAALDTAFFGLEDLLQGDGGRRLAGLRNVVVWGRAFTNILQNLRSTEPSFDAWYKPIVSEMQHDALLRFFYVLRSTLLKRGGTPTTTSLHIKQFYFPMDMARFGPPPPSAKGFFMGDQTGGCGWEVVLPDGSTDKFYVDLPADIGTVDLVMQDAPHTHLGNELADASVIRLATAHLNYFRAVLQRAKEKFASAHAV